MKRDRVEWGKVIQEPIWEAGEQVVVEMELGGPSRETGGQQGGGERPAAAVYLTA